MRFLEFWDGWQWDDLVSYRMGWGCMELRVVWWLLK